MNNNTAIESQPNHASFARTISAKIPNHKTDSGPQLRQIDPYLLSLAVKALLVPIGVGGLVGICIGNQFQLEQVWTIVYLGAGFVSGCFNARYRVSREAAMLREEEDEVEF